MSHSIPKDALASEVRERTRDAPAPPASARRACRSWLRRRSRARPKRSPDATLTRRFRVPPLPHRSFRAVYDAPGMRVTPDSRGYGVSMPFAAHAAAEPPSQLQATLVKSAKDVFAGTMGGIIVTAIGHPFDTVKVLLQTQPANNPIYSGPIDAVSKVLKSEGIGGLYKGITSPLAGQMFFRATLFFGYARAKEIVGVSPDDPLSYFRAGVLAWAAGTMFESPIDLYKSQWQSMIIKAKQTPNFVPPYKNVGERVRRPSSSTGFAGRIRA